MSNKDYTRLAVQVRDALEGGESFNLPLMSMRDFAQVLARLNK
jgi:hypothetical protein